MQASLSMEAALSLAATTLISITLVDCIKKLRYYPNYMINHCQEDTKLKYLEKYAVIPG